MPRDEETCEEKCKRLEGLLIEACWIIENEFGNIPGNDGELHLWWEENRQD